MTFTAHVNELRLHCAFVLPSKRHALDRRAANIALQADVSHFNRHFRARFGDTSTGVRGER